MNKKRSLYEAPKTEILVVQTEGVICESGSFGIGGFKEDDDVLNALNLFEGFDF